MKNDPYKSKNCADIQKRYYQLQKFLFLRSMTKMMFFLLVFMILYMNSRIKIIKKGIQNQCSLKSKKGSDEQITRSLIIIKYI